MMGESGTAKYLSAQADSLLILMSPSSVLIGCVLVTMKQIARMDFYFDVSCPFAYMASVELSRLPATLAACVTFRPVLLGAIYGATKAPQGKNGSASDVMNGAKRLIAQADMARTIKRYHVQDVFGQEVDVELSAD
jgi:2-hydroxychromene-2-carboxylate isomerase